MKKIYLLIVTLLSLSITTTSFAQSDEENARMTELETQITEYETVLKGLKAELRVLKGSNLGIGDTVELGDISLTLDAVFLTDDRNRFADAYDNVLVVEYTVLNNSDEDVYVDRNFDVYVDNQKSETYPYSENKSDSISAGRQATGVQGYGFNGEFELIELEATNNDYSNEVREVFFLKFDELGESTAQEDSDEDEASSDEVAENNTEEDIAYWNALALQYGFQPYNGFGDFNQFVASAEQLVYNAQTYGDPYYDTSTLPPGDEGLQTYYEQSDGTLWENPIYDNRWGPEDDPTNQVSQAPPVSEWEPEPEPVPEPPYVEPPVEPWYPPESIAEPPSESVTE